MQVMPLGASVKVKKGSKENTNSDLAHILGYTGTDMDIGGPPSPAGSEKETTGTGEALRMALLTRLSPCRKLQVTKVAAIAALWPACVLITHPTYVDC